MTFQTLHKNLNVGRKMVYLDKLEYKNLFQNQFVFFKLTFEENDGSERHDNHADKKVGHSKGHEEVVCHILQLPVHNDDAE